MLKFNVIAHVSTTEGVPEFARANVSSIEFDEMGVVSCTAYFPDKIAIPEKHSFKVDIRGERGTLIQSTECYDSDGREIFQCDVLEDEEKNHYEIVKVNGWLGILNLKTEEFNKLLDAFARKAKVLYNKAEKPTEGVEPKFEEAAPKEEQK